MGGNMKKSRIHTDGTFINNDGKTAKIGNKLEITLRVLPSSIFIYHDAMKVDIGLVKFRFGETKDETILRAKNKAMGIYPYHELIFTIK
jgi:peptidyl-tRNA hydrolase